MRVTAKQLARLCDTTKPLPLARLRTPRPRERDVQASIVRYLELVGAVVTRVNSGMLPTPDGRRVRMNVTNAGSCSDLLCCYQGVFLAVEVKVPGRKPTDGQERFLKAVERAGGVSVVATCVEDVAAAVKGIDSR